MTDRKIYRISFWSRFAVEYMGPFWSTGERDMGEGAEMSIVAYVMASSTIEAQRIMARTIICHPRLEPHQVDWRFVSVCEDVTYSDRFSDDPSFVWPWPPAPTPWPVDRPEGAKWAWGATVKKRRGSAWRGTVCGFYSTDRTPIGYAVESAFEPGSVQIYPQDALEDWDGK